MEELIQQAETKKRPRLIRLKEVMHITGLARATIYKYIKAKTFPMSVSLGDRAVAWVESEIDKWIEDRIVERDDCLQGE